MTKRQANTIIAGIVAVILTQILCTAVLVSSQERARRETAAQAAMRAADAVPRVIIRPAGARLIFDPVPIRQRMIR